MLSFHMDLFEVTSRLDIRSMIFEIKDEDCGICEKKDGMLFCAPTFSRCHPVCYVKIREAEEDLIKKINKLYQNNRDRDKAHSEAVKAVRQKLGGVSMKTYLEIYGAKKLKEIFDSLGVAAIQRPLARL